jgi:1,2-diacylglycerol 3-beta-galactosyltransferase
VKKVLILSNNSGGGHQKTARILAQTLNRHGWQPDIISTFRELFPDYFQLFGIEGEVFYNKLVLTKEMTHFIYRLFFISAHYFIIQRHRHVFAQRFATFWRQEQPDLIISVIPLLNQVIANSLTRIKPAIPFVIIQTDLFEFHETFWLTPTGTWFVADDKTYTVVGTEEAYQQVLSLFVSDKSRVFKMSGNIIDPHFLEEPEGELCTGRKALGLDPEKPVGLFLYGGFAPNRVLKAAKALNRLDNQVQFIFICGKNQPLKDRLEALETRYNKVVVGYTWQVPYYMRLSDFLIGKPGPGTIMEGLAANLPLLMDGSSVIIHESRNIEWVERHGFGLLFNHPAQLLTRIEELTRPEIYDPLKRKVSAYENRAVLEIPGVIETIMAHFHGNGE